MADDLSRRPSIATIFNPKKTHSLTSTRPSVVVTDEDTPGPPIQLTNGGRGSKGHRGSGASVIGHPSVHVTSPSPGDTPGSVDTPSSHRRSKCQKLKDIITCTTTKKIVAGVVVTFSVTTSWVGATHLIKDLFLRKVTTPLANPGNTTDSVKAEVLPQAQRHVFDAPFFTTWFCTAWTGLFFPLYMLCHLCCHRDTTVKTTLKTIAQNFRDRGVTFGKFVTRCCLFCALWVVTNYMYVYSLRILDCTDVMALYSVHVAFAYLLAWVILHEQFVGLRIVAVILCNTGIALLAYMDGIVRTKTLGGVVLAAASAAGSAVYKVVFKKVVGDASYGQVSVFFSVISLLNTLLLSPLVAALHLVGYEVILWESLPWLNLLLAAALSLVANLLGNFAIAITFEIFITLGLVIAIPVSGVLDIEWYNVKFEGMKLAGIVLIVCGFFLVLFPADWPQYITKLLRWGRHRKRHQQRQPPEPIDYRTGLISRSHLRSPSGLIR